LASAYIVSQRNETLLVRFSIVAPAGVAVTASSKLLERGETLSQVERLSRGAKVPFRIQGKEVSRIALRPSVVDLPPPGDGGYCFGYTADDIDEVIRAFEANKVQYTRDEICALIGSKGGGAQSMQPPVSTSDQVAESAFAVLRKDACSRNKKNIYALKFELNLQDVTMEQFQQGFAIRVAAQPLPYRGSKAATLKPVADGKYFPKALFLLQSTRAQNEKMFLTKWNRGRPGRVQELRIEDYTHMGLARTVAQPYLRGGSGTVELVGDSAAYSVCFKLQKVRQRLNGYRGGGG